MVRIIHPKTIQPPSAAIRCMIFTGGGGHLSPIGNHKEICCQWLAFYDPDPHSDVWKYTTFHIPYFNISSALTFEIVHSFPGSLRS